MQEYYQSLEKENGFAVHFLLGFIKSLKSISDKWLNAICWSSYLFGVFIIMCRI